MHLMRAAKIDQDQIGQKMIFKLNELSSEPIATIFINVEPDNLGGIVGMNQAMCALLGYNR